jgi:hypothetical protein
LGRSHPLSDPELKGSASVGPTEQCYFNIWTNALAGDTAQTDSITANIIITYVAMLIEPKDVTGS